MSLFTIDEKWCRKDGFCVAECPAMIIEMKTEDSFPTLVEGAEERCINCGHCVAVCPHSALTLARMPIESCTPVKEDLALGPEEVEQFLRSRRSIRSYQDRPVEKDELQRVIELARYGPTGSNSQQVQWLAVLTRDEVVRLTELAVDWMRATVKAKEPMAEQFQMAGIIRAWENGVDFICRGAPALVIAHGPEAYPIMGIDSTIALTFFDLAAPSLGLGTCWAGFFMAAMAYWPDLTRALGVPDGHKPFGAMMVGYPDANYHRLPARNEARITWME
jgi:nitroreductase/NAD-dependent dihydropyrimidine dehydrogenase PreA subunit